MEMNPSPQNVNTDVGVLSCFLTFFFMQRQRKAFITDVFSRCSYYFKFQKLLVPLVASLLLLILIIFHVEFWTARLHLGRLVAE